MTAMERPPIVGRAYTALVVDEEKIIGNILKMSFSATFDNLRITAADNVSGAVDALHQFDFDVVVVNVSNMESPFLELIQEIKHIKKVTPIVVTIDRRTVDLTENRIKLIESGCTFILEKPFTAKEVIGVIENLIELNEVYRGLEHSSNIIKALTRAIEARDTYTIGHAETVAELSIKMFDHMGLRGDQREDLYVGCLLHDIGKIGISDNILNKPGPLTPEEYEVIKKHPLAGYEICNGLHRIKPALPIILQHHERLDGSGYPHNTEGGDISILAQICSVADVYHSLISDRAYRSALTTKEAFSIIDEEVENGKLSLFFVQSLKCVLKDEGCVDLQ